MNPYLIIGALVALIVAFGAGYRTGYKVEEASCEADKIKIEQAAVDAYKADVAKANAAATKLETKTGAINEKFRVVTKTVDKIVERPVYRNVCLDPDGLRVVNEALQRQGADPAQPPKPVP